MFEPCGAGDSFLIDAHINTDVLPLFSRCFFRAFVVVLYNWIVMPQ
jgi:hypothetical protein